MQQLFARKHLMFSIVLALQLCLLFWAGSKKFSFFIDELWSYNLANAYFSPLLGDIPSFYERWISQEELISLVTVNPDHRFAFDSVFYNQEQDVHPPFYYCILHFLCSLFPTYFNKWIGLGINIVSFALTQVVLYTMADRMFKNKHISILVVVLYGFSLGAVNTAMTIRMYMLLTLFVTLCFFVNVLILDALVKNESSRRMARLIVLLSPIYFLGFLTQYLFVVPAFFISLILLIIIIGTSRLKLALIYVVATMSPLLLSVMTFPAAITHTVGGGYRGAQAISLLKNESLIDRFSSFAIIANKEICFSSWIIFLCLVILAFTVFRLSTKVIEHRQCVLKFSNECNQIVLNCSGFLWIVTTLSTALAFAVLSKIPEINDTRYIFCMYPLIFLSLGSFLCYCANFVKIRATLFTCLAIVFAILLASTQINVKDIKWSQRHAKPLVEALQKDKLPIVYLTTSPNAWPMMGFYNFFILSRETYATTDGENVSKLCEDKKDFILFVSRFVKDHGPILDRLKSQGCLCENKYLDWHGKGYLVQNCSAEQR